MTAVTQARASQRIRAIDTFRGLTMFLMVWVNDFWRLSDIPEWLLHMPAERDALGFSDIIFPAFLFITGLSLPFAYAAREAKGEKPGQILRHLLLRSGSLLLMGIFMVNLESYDSSSALLPKAAWQCLMAIAFIAIWNAYPKAWRASKIDLAFRVSGFFLLAILAAIYRGTPSGDYTWMQTHWWGILGLIAWSYLIAGLILLWGGNRLLTAGIGFLALCGFHLACASGLLEWLSPLRRYLWIISDGALPSLTLAGCFAGSLLQSQSIARKKTLLIFSMLGAIGLLAGFVARAEWGISKIYATPSWTLICIGICFITLALLAACLKENRTPSRWERWLDPAASATLTCYLLPYLLYPLANWLGLEMPVWLNTGLLGLAGSAAFAFFTVQLTGLLGMVGVRLRL